MLVSTTGFNIIKLILIKNMVFWNWKIYIILYIKNLTIYVLFLFLLHFTYKTQILKRSAYRNTYSIFCWSSQGLILVWSWLYGTYHKVWVQLNLKFLVETVTLFVFSMYIDKYPNTFKKKIKKRIIFSRISWWLQKCLSPKKVYKGAI